VQWMGADVVTNVKDKDEDESETESRDERR
jgi:hypothetical protein